MAPANAKSCDVNAETKPETLMVVLDGVRLKDGTLITAPEGLLLPPRPRNRHITEN